jgi:general secretion pathway protein L
VAISGEYWWVYLGDREVYWARRLSNEERPREEGSAATLAETPVPAGARVVACVPGQAVRVHWVNLPVRSRKRLLEALPFALEEELLRDPSEYHLVPLKRMPALAERAVAVVEHERMRGWVEPLQEQGYRLRMLIPDFLAVPPSTPDTWSLDASDSPMLLRRAEGLGGAAIPGQLGSQPPGPLLLALEEARVAPETLVVRVARAEDRERVEQWQPWFEPRGIRVVAETDERPRAAWLARQPLPDRDANLLTGAYTSREDPRVLLRRYTVAGGLAAALVLVWATQWFLELGQLRAEQRQIRSAMEATYRKAFPEAKNVVDPRFQMEQRLKQMRAAQDSGEKGGDLLAALRRVAPALGAESGDRRVQGLTFDGKDLVLELTVPDYGTLERLQKQLDRYAEAQVESSELSEGRVASRIRLKGES